MMKMASSAYAAGVTSYKKYSKRLVGITSLFMNPNLVTVGGGAVLCFLPGLEKDHLSLASAMAMESNILQGLTVASDALADVRSVSIAPTP